MLHDRNAMEAALAPLVGLPLWTAGRAADLQWFHFGAKHEVVTKAGKYKGQARTVGELALHVLCPWRIVGLDGIVTASSDLFVPTGDPDHEPPDWQWDTQGANRCDERLRAWILDHEYTVHSVAADAYGGLRLALSEGFALEVFPDDSLPHERWRIFQPGRETPHFVVYGSGIETE